MNKRYGHSVWQLLWACLFVCTTGLVATQEELFLMANDYYHQHQYTKALESYQAMQTHLPVVCYNMGNCAYYMNNMLDALVYWSRAEHAASLAELRDIYAHKKLIYDKIGLGTPDDMWCTTKISYLHLQLLVLCCWLLVWIFLFFLRGWLRILLFIPTISLFLCSSVLLYKETSIRSMQYGYVNNHDGVLYAGPETWYHQLGKLPYASCITITQTLHDWYGIRSGTISGWMPAKDIKVV